MNPKPSSICCVGNPLIFGHSQQKTPATVTQTGISAKSPFWHSQHLCQSSVLSNGVCSYSHRQVPGSGSTHSTVITGILNKGKNKQTDNQITMRQEPHTHIHILRPNRCRQLTTNNEPVGDLGTLKN